MAYKSCGPNQGRVDGAHGTAAVAIERQSPTALAAEPLRPSVARSDRYIVRTDSRYPFHAPEPARQRGSLVSGKSRGPGKFRDFGGSPSARLRAVHLSPREREILRYVAEGHTTKELAAALNIAESTAEWHISNILVKLGAASRAEAVAIGLREGLLEREEQPIRGESARDLATRRAHRARSWRDDRVIHFDLLGLHLGEIRIGRGRRDLARTVATGVRKRQDNNL